MIGEWVALPVLRSTGAGGVTDPLAEQVMYPQRSACSPTATGCCGYLGCRPARTRTLQSRENADYQCGSGSRISQAIRVPRARSLPRPAMTSAAVKSRTVNLLGRPQRLVAMTSLDETSDALLIGLYRMTEDDIAARRQLATCTRMLARTRNRPRRGRTRHGAGKPAAPGGGGRSTATGKMSGRHGVRFVRHRPELQPANVPTLTDQHCHTGHAAWNGTPHGVDRPYGSDPGGATW